MNQAGRTSSLHLIFGIQNDRSQYSPSAVQESKKSQSKTPQILTTFFIYNIV